MLNFPIPYPNELIYSTIARAGVHHAIGSPKQLLDEVFSNRKVIATIDLPNHLSCILEHLPSSYTLEKLVYEHTLFPLYAIFTPENTRIRCLKWMQNKSQGSIHLALGVAASRVKQISTLRYCSDCLNDQYIQYGECFWSRVWQVQGANCCIKHRAILSEFVLNGHVIGRHQFIGVNKENRLNQSIESPHALDFIVSNRIEELLALPPVIAPTFHQWSQFYQLLAERSECKKGLKHIDHSKILSQVIKLWDKNWLKQHNLEKLNTETSWLRTIFRKHRKSFSYLEHIIILETFSPRSWTWSSILNEVKQIPLRSKKEKAVRARNLDATILEIKRNEWQLLVQQFGVKNSRLKSGALYAWLYRNDKDWLIRKNTKFYISSSRGSVKVDWSIRDIQTTKLLFQILNQWTHNIELPRQSKSWFLKQISQRSTIEKNLHQLPLTSMFLETFSEDVSSYQIRRITRSIIKFKLDNQHISRWKILRQAGLSEERLTDEAMKFLTLIRRENYV